MRRYVLIGISIILALLIILQIAFGVGLGKSYGSVKKAYEDNIEAKKELDKINSEGYDGYQASLDASVAEFKSNQEQYNAKAQTEKSMVNVLDKTKLKETLTKYAKANVLDMTYDIKKATEMNSVSNDFIYCDIEFAVKGEYYDIDKFIETLENDFTLGFTIQNFEMNSTENGVEAKFIVKNVAIKEG